MQRDSRAEIRRAVFSEIEGEGFREKFERIRGESSALQRFTSSAELLAFLRDADPSQFDQNDAILYALLRSALSEDETGKAAKVLLLAVIWPALEHVYSRLLPRLRNAADPFSEVYWAFLEEIRLWNLAKRDYMAIELARRTEKRVHRALRREERYQAACREMLEAARAVGPDGFRAVDVSYRKGRLSEHDRAEVKALLAEFVDREVISLEESLLIAGHALYGRRLKDLAAEKGIGYRTVSKRYQRAAKKVREALQQNLDFF